MKMTTAACKGWQEFASWEDGGRRRDGLLEEWLDYYYGVDCWEWVERGRTIKNQRGNLKWRTRRLKAWERLLCEITTRFGHALGAEERRELCRGIYQIARTREWTYRRSTALWLARWTSRPPIRIMVTPATLRTVWCVPRSEWEALGRGAKNGRHKPKRPPVQLSLPLAFS